MDKRMTNRGSAPRHARPEGMEAPSEFQQKLDDGVIIGRNAVLEALESGLHLDKLYIAKGEVDKALGHIASRARGLGSVVVESDRRKLDYLSHNQAHQGIVALAAVKAYCEVEDILAHAKERDEVPLVIICDEISDPHNLGAILRTAEGVGAHGVIIPKRRSAGITAIVQKTSAGAVNHIPVARVPNVVQTIKDLKEAGLWVYGAAMEGEQTLWQTDFSGPMALLIGSEGDGLGRLVKEHCDFLVHIPMVGKVSSLNASVSAAVLLYEVTRQRNKG